MIVMGLSGNAGVGKDYIASTVLKPLGFKPWAYAWHFKIWLVGQGKWTFDDVFFHKPEAVRHDLQQEGTERGRKVYGDSIWIRTAAAWMTLLQSEWGIDRVVFTDIRFPNEVEGVRALGGKVVRIVAPKRAANNKLDAEARQHSSETELQQYTDFDGYVYNDPDTRVPLADQFASTFKDWGWTDVYREVSRPVATTRKKVARGAS
jgi:hypothetical protein